jgi:hypothetical protein
VTARLAQVLLLLAALTVPAAAADAGAEIEALIRAVAESGCIYTRNGTDHDAVEAADHLRLKYRRGKRYIDSAEQFIDRLASESSWTGRAYTITCDGTTLSSNEWLHRELKALRDTD